MSGSIMDQLAFARGPAMRNRIALAPLTNLQSYEDGSLSDDEFMFLSTRAQGGFGLTMTCAAFVNIAGKGFSGQLGIASDAHDRGLERLAATLNAAGTVSCVQLQHSGLKADPALSGGLPRAPWDDHASGAMALSTPEVEKLIADFVQAGLRASRAGFHGVELHAAHGYILGQFLDAERNQRNDSYGRTFENRTRIVWDIIKDLRTQAGADFQIGVRLSPERYGMPIDEVCEFAEQLMLSGMIDYVDMSLWDVFKSPETHAEKDRRLIDIFAALNRGDARLGVAGKIYGAVSAQNCLEAGADFVLLGHAAILHQNFPRLVQGDKQFESISLPVTADYLKSQGVGPKFIDYLATTWDDFVIA